MRSSAKNKILWSALVTVAAICVGISLTPASNPSNAAAKAKSQACPNDEPGNHHGRADRFPGARDQAAD
jgi:hypothetical protein